MPVIQQQFYFGNGTSLADADALYLDSSLTICAPDGFYSDGTIVREQSGCVLLTASNCNCGIPCVNSTYDLGDTLYSQSNINLSSFDTGAIVVRITNGTVNIPFSFAGYYNGNVYNKASGNFNGVYQGSISGQPTIIGSAVRLTNCGLDSPNSFNQSFYDWNGISFAYSSSSYIYTDPGQNAVIPPPNWDTYIVMVIPKPTSTPINFSVTIGNFCGAQEQVYISCPQSLPSFKCSNAYATSVGNCNVPIVNKFYVAGVNGFGSGSGLRLGLYDLVFSDPNGQYALPDGYYRALTDSATPVNPFAPTYPNYNYMHVVNGVIVSIFNESTCGALWPTP